MSRIATFAVGTVTSLALVAGSLTAAEAAPLPAQTGAKVAGENTAIDHVRYRGYGYGYGRGYGYRRGYGGRAAGALAAGAALGLIGGALAARHDLLQPRAQLLVGHHRQGRRIIRHGSGMGRADQIEGQIEGAGSRGHAHEHKRLSGRCRGQ